MEVGAVKQAFNNEVILLKKNLNQAKIQVIHKLTRKAKTFAEKKCPDKLKEKLKRKAESAVKEVLIIKKIKPKDLAQFIVTHKGKLNDYLNKPEVDSNKACARLLLHKALTNKYQTIKDRFGNVSIKDLFMSRQERRQLKKEAREKQDKKKKKRTNSETDNTGGVWDVEENKQELLNGNLKDEDNNSTNESESEAEENGIESNDDLQKDGSEQESDSEIDEENDVSEKLNSKSVTVSDKNDVESDQSDDFEQNSDSDEEEIEPNEFNKLKARVIEEKPQINKDNSKVTLINEIKLNKQSMPQSKKVEKRPKDNKNKNLNEKLKKRKFNKDINDAEEQQTTIVDPFFITSSGDNYMSLVEPRLPDEVKEVHKEGNRKYRRAVMFGHIKPRRNDRPNKFNQKNDRNNSKDFKNTGPRNNKFDNRKTETNDEGSAPPEKLHPSWEAKKKQSTIVPFKGKKIMFDDS